MDKSGSCQGVCGSVIAWVQALVMTSSRGLSKMRIVGTAKK